jgi:hypothetical protein
MEPNVDTPVADRGISGGGDAPRERVSVRDSLRNAFDDARRDEGARSSEREAPEDETIEEEVVEAAEGDETPVEEPDEGIDTPVVERDEAEPAAPKPIAAPTSWTKEAKAEWAKTPDRIKKEVLKREKDMERGVEAIKSKYAEVDQALAPYMPTIQQFGKTPGQAVGQLFAWFDALAKNPDEAFPALIQSYKYNPEKMLAKYGYFRRPPQQQQQPQPNGQMPNGQGQTGQQPEVPVHPAVQAYINKIEQRLGTFENQVGQQFNALGQHFTEQSAAKTQEMLERWAADKPHFESVRTLMGHLLTPDPTSGIAAIPLRDGKVDLDAAYDAAVYASPSVRAMVLAESQAKADAARKAKQEAAVKAQQEKTEKARRASGSISTSAPGLEVSRRSTPSKGVSVRDSLKAAISELSDR